MVRLRFSVAALTFQLFSKMLGHKALAALVVVQGLVLHDSDAKFTSKITFNFDTFILFFSELCVQYVESFRLFLILVTYLM